MSDRESVIQSFGAVWEILMGLTPTGHAGVDSSIENAITRVRLALTTLAADISPAAGAGAYDVPQQMQHQAHCSTRPINERGS